MQCNEFIAIVLDAGRETAATLKGVSAKLEFYVKVITMVLAAADVKVELENSDGLRDVNAIRIADQVRIDLKALANETYLPPPCAKEA